MTSGSKWNQNEVKTGKVSTNNYIDAFHSQQHTFSYHNTEMGDYLYSDNGTEKAILHSINLVLFNMAVKLKRNFSEMFTPLADKIPSRRTFVSHARHLKESAEMIVYL